MSGHTHTHTHTPPPPVLLFADAIQATCGVTLYSVSERDG